MPHVFRPSTIDDVRTQIGGGFGLEDNRIAIETVAKIREAVVESGGEMHPFVGGGA